MISFTFDEEQLMIQRQIRQMMRDKGIASRAAEIDVTEEFPWDIKGYLQEAGLLNMLAPEEYGGAGASWTTFCLATEEVAKVSADAASIMFSVLQGILFLTLVANEEQKRRFSTPIFSQCRLTGFSTTEPNAGSDLYAIETTARLDGNHYVVNGTKIFSSGAHQSDFFVVLVKTDPSKRAGSTSMLWVEKDTPGFSLERDEDKMGSRCIGSTELIFNNALVPKENLIGAEGRGIEVASAILPYARVFIGAVAVGLAQGALDYALNYSKERITFGKPIAQHQAIQFMLVDMATHIEAARSLLYRTAAAIDQKIERLELVKLSSMVKYLCTDLAWKVTTDAVDILGGHGYVSEHPVARMMREAKGWQLLEGTSQMQRRTIASVLLGMKE